MSPLPKKFRRSDPQQFVKDHPTLSPRRLSAGESLLERGRERAAEFCLANGVEMPRIDVVGKDDWMFDACAYYRLDGIRICLEHCGRPCGEVTSRNWSWPGSTTDRTPYGVICHELGHHLDYLASDQKGSYYGDCSVNMRRASGEKPISGYCPNDAEWFAEMARVFMTNHALLLMLRPRTWDLFAERWTPVSDNDWRSELGNGVPDRVVRSLENKGAV